ncbi:small glutamine-rich tetratricopeptide repeat-containing protein 2 [Hordeum vulgare subsp. vulgare]|uniref:Uncharacterized protein n=1 Tax=Hordeum vulgare subsp. vulgare TaxID=112509 RepID=A0A8I6WXA8_HORVV|nr:small glutamine-rich tetratricopeptide repeat-containing protein 2 [Hordeum vulgare subsp. vulgare]
MAMAVAGSHSLGCAIRPPRRRGPRAAAEAVEVRVRVCTNRTCARQGGREVLAALEGLSPPSPRVGVASCGCLGRCGSGPNVGASVPGRGNAVFGHVGTAARAAQLLEHLLGAAEFDAAAGLAALALRQKAEAAVADADAEALFTESIAVGAPGGLHLAYGGRCKARIAIGDTAGALADAEEAIRIAPRFPQSHLSRGDALFAMGEYHSSEDAYAHALDLDPSIRRSKSFKARLERLREKLVTVSSSSP